MKKLKRIGTLATGIIIGIVLSVATTVFAAGVIKSAVYNSNKVIFDGEELELAMPLISVTEEETPNSFSNYMPVRAVLEAMGYTVGWDGDTNSVTVSSNVAPSTAPAQAAAAPVAKVKISGRDFTTENAPKTQHVVDYQTLIEILWLFDCTTEFDEQTGTVIITPIVEEISEPLAVRDLLGKLEKEKSVKSEIVFNNEKREIYLTKGTAKATIIFPAAQHDTAAKVVCGSNEAPITLVIKGGTSFINEKEIITALTKVGFLK